MSGINAPVIDEFWTRAYRSFPHPSNCRDERVISGEDAEFVAVFSDPIYFSIRVPEAAQRRYGQDDFVPSEEYHVYWDGEVLLVSWDQEINQQIPVFAGGHSALEILTDVLARLGARLYVQACRPGCDLGFIHQTIRATSDPALDVPQWSADPERSGLFNLALPVAWNPAVMTEYLYWQVRACAHDFARMKNRAQRVLDIDHKTQHELDDLLTIQRQIAGLEGSSLWNRTRHHLELRDLKKDARERLATLWLALAAIRDHRRSWADDRLSFRENLESIALFVSDTRSDELAIHELDLDPVRQAMEYAAARLDSGALSSAMVVGALSGTAAGALITALIQLLGR